MYRDRKVAEPPTAAPGRRNDPPVVGAEGRRLPWGACIPIIIALSLLGWLMIFALLSLVT